MRIGKHEVTYPLIQGGMAVRVSGHRWLVTLPVVVVLVLWPQPV